MRYYIKEYLNQKYEIAAMDGYDAYVSIYNHEDIHLTSQQKETVSCLTVDNQYYYGIGQEECHDYCQIAQYLDMDPLRFLQFYPSSRDYGNYKNFSQFQDIHHCMDFRKIIEDEIKELVLKEQLHPDSLLYTLLKAKGYVYQSSDENIPYELLHTPIEELGLSVRSYNCLKRANIHTLRDLRQVMKNDGLYKIRNMAHKLVKEIIDAYCQFLNQNFSYHLELHFMQKKSPITFVYDKQGFALKSIVSSIFQDFFLADHKSLLKHHDAIFTPKITNVLLWMGYSNIDDVEPHLPKLDDYFYKLSFTSKPDALQKRYNDYLHAHITYHEIPYSIYQKLINQEASQKDIQNALQKYNAYVESVVEQINNKIYYVENDQTREFYHDDENDTVDIYDMGIYECIQYDDLKKIMDSLEDICVIKEVMKKIRLSHSYYIIKDLNEYKAQVDMIIKNHSQLEAKELIEQLLDNPFLLKHQYEELVQYIRLKYNS